MLGECESTKGLMEKNSQMVLFELRFSLLVIRLLLFELRFGWWLDSSVIHGRCVFFTAKPIINECERVAMDIYKDTLIFMNLSE